MKLIYNLTWFFISFGIGTCLLVLLSPISFTLAAILFAVVSLYIQLMQPDYVLEKKP